MTPIPIVRRQKYYPMEVESVTRAVEGVTKAVTLTFDLGTLTQMISDEGKYQLGIL